MKFNYSLTKLLLKQTFVCPETLPARAIRPKGLAAEGLPKARLGQLAYIYIYMYMFECILVFYFYFYLFDLFFLPFSTRVYVKA